MTVPLTARRRAWRSVLSALITIVAVGSLEGCSPGAGPTPDPPAKELVAKRADLTSSPLHLSLVALAERARRLDATLVVPSGVYTTEQTIALPAGTRIRLDPAATLTGSLPGAALVRLASDTSFTGGVVENTSTEPSFDMDLAQGAHRVVIDDTTFRGTATSSVYLAAKGLRQIRVSGSRFEHVVYGVLLNPPAQDARSITINGNHFSDVCGDSIELNAVTAGSAERVKGVTVSGNHMQDACGSGDSAGFGIGFAGVSDFEIRSNTVDAPRNEAIHLEDGTTSGTVADNLIVGGGHGDRPAIAIYRTTSRVNVTDNRIRDFSGGGVAVRWDSLGSATHITIKDNDLRHISGEGITVAGGAGTGPFTVQGNLLDGIGGNGIAVLGSHAHSAVTDNSLRDVKGEAIVQALRGDGVTVVQGNGVG